MTAAIIDQANTQPWHWPYWSKQQLSVHLADVSPAHMHLFCDNHDVSMVSCSLSVRGLASKVRESLVSTSEKLHMLQRLASNPSEDCPTKLQARKWVLGALGDVVRGLKHFEVITHEFKRDNTEAMNIVWSMFRRVYDMSIIVASLSFDPGAESVFSCSKDFLMEIEANDFCFENKAFQCVENPLPVAVIHMLLESTPLCRLPHASNRTEPQYVYDYGIYSPQLFDSELWNYDW